MEIHKKHTSELGLQHASSYTHGDDAKL